ncbi:sigma-70 family RNA polymerase sigma factor [Microbacterium sp. BG28]|uniref:RNA polymerase sigma factor n=1 Tax=Microbacterium sp. BG28 TaxID=3097356 RepID=UPI002A5AA80A|nr:sigma-70 family RNA polymerase sigma factor [Microbacterium sp. BG28]MDY0828702.1 sigma-70 family RNA polymerase sigma factor [Microbacterium sp. BG28]
MTRRADAVRARYIDLISVLGPELLRYFERRSPDTAEDLVSEVLIVGWRRRARIPDVDEHARMWFYGVARNVLRSQMRSRARQYRVLDALRGVSRPSTADDASEHVALRDAVERLPPDLREVIELAHWEELSLVEIGQLLHIPASTVRGRYQRARERLAQGLGSSSPSPSPSIRPGAAGQMDADAPTLAAPDLSPGRALP